MTVFRIGGEEFVIILPSTNTHEALKIAARICNQISSNKFYLESIKANIQVTVSIGVASKESNDDAVSDIISRADVALYSAKRNGRNQVA